MSNSLRRISNSLSRLLYWIAGFSIVSMMILTCIDIVLRFSVTLYHKYHLEFLGGLMPIPGTYELVKYMGAVAASFAMAHTCVERGHVAVSFVVNLFPKRTQAVIETLTNFLGLIFFVLLAWQSVLYGNELWERGEVSLTLQLPFYPFIYGIAFSAMSVCLVLLIDLMESLKEAVGK